MTKQGSKTNVGSGPGNRRLLRKLFGKLLLILGGVFFGLVLCEAVLRVSGYSPPDFYSYDPVVGVTLRPNAEGWWTKEGRAYIRINSQGLRDREHTRAKPANTLRIAVLGDSYAEALQLPMEKAFWAIMEARLRECVSMRRQNVEVLNFGVSGFGTAQELLTLRQRVWDYSPDIVLLAITRLNDISDDSRALKQSNDVPYFVFSDGRLVLDNSFRNEGIYRLRDSSFYVPVRWVREHSRVVQALYEARNAVSLWLQSRSQQNGSPADLGVNYAVYQEPRNDAWRDAWRVTEALIVQMRDEVKEKRAKFLVVTLSAPAQVLPDPNRRAEFMKQHDVKDLFYPDLRIRDLCEREGIPILMLGPDLQRYAEQNKVFLHGFGENLGRGHWNETGHQVGGEMMAARLCTDLGG
jgi:hypothetical protein